MSRVAVDSTSAPYGGMSRLPRPVGQGHLGTYQPKMQSGPGSGKKPSKLEQMQVEFQKNIMKEKEQKLINLYEENQQRALHKVSNGNNNKGMVRDFFRERRAMGSGNSLNHNQPTMESMYNRKKLEHKLSQQSMGRTQSYNPSYSQKQSAGRDRSNLLAPINGPGKNGSPGSGNPFPHKAQIVRPRTYKDVSQNNPHSYDRNIPLSAPTGTMMDSSSDDSPPPNPKQLQMLQQKRQMIKNQRNYRAAVTQQTPEQTQKKTDFQKWQEEQDQNRANRLKKQREMNGNLVQKHQPYPDDEGFDDDSVESDENDLQEEMKRKQALLLQQIQDQQRELERLRQERMQEEVEEKKEKARRKKMEEERKKREKEEEEWRRKVEEDERIKRTWEEEKSRKMEEEKQRMRKASQTSKYEYEESEDEEESYHQHSYKRPSPPPQKQPTPPPQFKPSAPTQPKPSTSTRKYHPPKSRTPPTQEAPPPRGDHTALYRDADQQEGAYENVGKLVSCYNCSRKFAADRIEKHEQFCKNLTKKRKVLDPSKLRTQGTEMAQFVNTKQPNPKGRKQDKPKKSNWREQHESFMTAIKYAKKCKQIEEQGGSLADLPPPPRTENSDYVQCPYCTRRFNPQTAERHIPHCKNSKSRPAPPKRK